MYNPPEPTRHQLTKEIDERWTPCIQSFLNALDAGVALNPLDLSGDTLINPSRLVDILTLVLGYEEESYTSSAYDLDFEIIFTKPNHTTIKAYGTGMTFELYLQRKENIDVPNQIES